MSSSATINAVINNAQASLLVVYPHSNMPDAELRAELLVIRDWFIAFNSDQPVRTATHFVAPLPVPSVSI